jgi:hypothetical protein
VLGPGVGDDLPVVDSFVKLNFAEEITENIEVFFNIKLSFIKTYLNILL